jgi:catechol 2,3-dioxygenase-like lactoylglutathione lyase family enzyme
VETDLTPRMDVHEIASQEVATAIPDALEAGEPEALGLHHPEIKPRFQAVAAEAPQVHEHTEVDMTTTTPSTDKATAPGRDATTDFKLEVVIVPVSDVDRAKRFYGSIGWREDADFVFGEDLRVLQFTPPGSDASIIFGAGIVATPGSLEGLVLAVDDIDAARDDLIARGVYVSDVFHHARAPFSADGRLPGPAPEHASYQSFASFSDPDGNVWLLQEVKTRFPGRVAAKPTFASTGELARAMHRAEAAHGVYEQSLGHRDEDWPAWYAEYMVAEKAGTELPL